MFFMIIFADFIMNNGIFDLSRSHIRIRSSFFGMFKYWAVCSLPCLILFPIWVKKEFVLFWKLLKPYFTYYDKLVQFIGVERKNRKKSSFFIKKIAEGFFWCLFSPWSEMDSVVLLEDPW